MKYRIYIDEVGSSDLKSKADLVSGYLSLNGVVIDLQLLKLRFLIFMTLIKQQDVSIPVITKRG
ncbi:MAG: hypothetical protein ACKOW8_13450 [Flavobacteriales bacterium]